MQKQGAVTNLISAALDLKDYFYCNLKVFLGKNRKYGIFYINMKNLKVLGEKVDSFLPRINQADSCGSVRLVLQENNLCRQVKKTFVLFIKIFIKLTLNIIGALTTLYVFILIFYVTNIDKCW